MNVAQLISAADSPASSPMGPTQTVRTAEDGATWATNLRDLKTRLVAEQHELLALVIAYEDAAEQLQFETECQQVLVDKYAEIRARRMQLVRSVPLRYSIPARPRKQHDGVSGGDEERGAQAAARGIVAIPVSASRRELHAQLMKQWKLLSDDEQEVWNAKFRTLYPPQGKAEVVTKKQPQAGPTQPSSAAKRATSGGLKSASSSVPAKRKNSLTGGSSHSAAKPVVSGVVTEPKPKKRKPTPAASDPGLAAEPEALPAAAAAVVPKKKRASPAKKKIATSADATTEDGAESEKSEKATPAKAKKRSAAPKPAIAKKETPSKKAPSKLKSGNVAAISVLSSPNSFESVRKKPATKKKSTPTPPQQRKSAPAAAGGAVRPRTPRAKKFFGKKTAAAKKRLNGDDGDRSVSDDDDDDDDDDEDEDEDNDNESLSSAGGSASDEDSDEHMAQLPTGAFG